MGWGGRGAGATSKPTHSGRGGSGEEAGTENRSTPLKQQSARMGMGPTGRLVDVEGAGPGPKF